MPFKTMTILSADTYFLSHIWFLNEFEVVLIVLKPPEGKELFHELPYRHSLQLGGLEPLCADRHQPPVVVTMFAYQGREESSSRHTFTDPSLTPLLFL